MVWFKRLYRTQIQPVLARPFGPHEGKKGMTLIEIIIVVALLATLMAILVTNITKQGDEARVDQARIGMGGIAQALQMYRVHNNSYPTTQQGLGALVTDPGNASRWRGPYIEKEKLLDPWSNEYGYESDGRKFQIISGGLDGQIGGADDIFYPPKEGEAAAPAEAPAQ
jgi:general secretion pathway protein G